VTGKVTGKENVDNTITLVLAGTPQVTIKCRFPHTGQLHPAWARSAVPTRRVPRICRPSASPSARFRRDYTGGPISTE
jgi:hypothetical protein